MTTHLQFILNHQVDPLCANECNITDFRWIKTIVTYYESSVRGGFYHTIILVVHRRVDAEQRSFTVDFIIVNHISERLSSIISLTSFTPADMA